MSKITACFGGGNTKGGFVNYLDVLTKESKRLYILKGGCGCGKNSLMKKVAKSAESHGLQVEKVYCASDPCSLDALILPQKGVAVADGTAPHELSPRLAGAMDNLVDLGEYWDSAALAKRSEEITKLSAKKKKLYAQAYALLASADKLRGERRSIIHGAVHRDKMSAAAERYAERLCKKGAVFSTRIRPLYAFCGEGTVTVARCENAELWQIKDGFDLKSDFLSLLLAAFMHRGAPLALSPDPTDAKRLAAIYSEKGGVLFAEGDEEGERVINMERFVDKAAISVQRRKLRFLAKTEEAIKKEAAAALAEARACHLKLEEIYIPTMDFARVDERTKLLIKEMLA